jgi:hypothetical protein
VVVVAVVALVAIVVMAVLRWLVAGFPSQKPGFEPRSGHVGFVMDKVALRQVFSEYFGFPCQFSFHRLLHIHHLSSGAGTIGQLVADVPSGLSLTPHQETKLTVVEVLEINYIHGEGSTNSSSKL